MSASNEREPQPRRKPSMDLSRLRDFPSSLSLRKDTSPSSGTNATFSRLRNFGSARLRKEPSGKNLSASFGFDRHPSTNVSPTTADASMSPSIEVTSPAGQATDIAEKPVKRRSRLLDAFKSSRKSQGTFEVIRKPQTARHHSSSSKSFQGSSLAETNSNLFDPDLSASSRPDVDRQMTQSSVDTTSPRSRPTSLPNERKGGRKSFASDRSAEGEAKPQDVNYRAAHPPSTSKTRRPASSLTMGFGRRTSGNLDPAPAISGAPSPSPSPGTEAAAGSFNLHSFRNIRRGSDASRPDLSTTSRRESLNAAEDFITPSEEIDLPIFGERPKAQDTKGPAAASNALPAAKSPAIRPAAPISTTFTPNQPNSSSISVARFRQAARTRSETGNSQNVEDVAAAASRFPQDAVADATPSPGLKPMLSLGAPGTMSPSQELAALEAEVMQGGRSTPLLRIAREQSPLATKPSDRDEKELPPIAAETPASQAHATSTRTVRDLPAPDAERRRGFFIVVEGLDRAGKSTQVARLSEKLGAKEINFPDRTTAIGQMINSYLAQTSDLDDKAIHLLFSANRWECVQSIISTLASGESIVCDRYAFSGIAYSCSKGLPYEWCRAPDIGLPLPDLTVFLDLDADTAAKRGGYGEERYEKQEFQAKVREAFKKVSADVKGHGGTWITIDAGGTLDEVTRDIQKAVFETTSRIDTRIGALGKLFIGTSPEARLVSHLSNGPDAQPDYDRPPVSPSFFSHFRSASQSNQGQRSSFSYANQLAAMRAAATDTLYSLFGSHGEEEPKKEQATEPPAVSPVSKGQGVDAGRVLAGFNGSKPGRKMTLVEMIDQIEAGRSPPVSSAEELPPPTLPWVAGEANARTRSASVGETSTTRSAYPASDAISQSTKPSQSKFPSTFALANRSRRSLNASDTLVVANHDSSSDEQSFNDADHHQDKDLANQTSSAALTGPLGLHKAPPQTNGLQGTPLISPSPQRAASMTRSASSALESAVMATSPSPGVESPPAGPLLRQLGSPLETQRGGKSPGVSSVSSYNDAKDSLQPPRQHRTSAVSSSQSLRSPSLQAASPAASPPPMAHPNHGMGDGGGMAPSSYYLAMMNAQQQRADMQEAYMRNYMAMMANPMMAQQAQYQMMMMQQQQQAYLNARSMSNYPMSEVGTGSSSSKPVAAFMQPGHGVSDQALQQETSGRRHTRTRSGASPAPSPPGSPQMPMLSMMMAAPPPSAAHANMPMMQPQAPFMHFGYPARPAYASAQSEIGTGPSRSHRALDKSRAHASRPT